MNSPNLMQSTFCLLAMTVALWNQSKKTDHDKNENITKCTLTEQEEKNKVMEASISTITWFEGDFDRTVNEVKERVEQMVKLNPWLLGRIKKSQGKLHLEYADDKISHPGVESIFERKESLELHLGTNVEEAIVIASKEQLTVKPGKQLINNDE